MCAAEFAEMPITQQRMLAVVDEALDARQQHAALIADAQALLVSEHAQNVKLHMLYYLFSCALVPPLPHAQREREHFAKTQRRNAQAAKRMRQARRAEQADELDE